ncbi:MAG: hypothetical protein KKD44_04285 [Proteobacteria bacterium]|nr:hypothetical protein [Pseudomonadota bacterium]
MNRDMKIILAGALAGILSGAWGWVLGQMNGRGMVLGAFLSLGLIVIKQRRTNWK